MGGHRGQYPVGAKFKGRVTNITDYGAFVELEPGIEGLIHVSEMSWTKKNVHPGKIVSTSPGSGGAWCSRSTRSSAASRSASSRPCAIRGRPSPRSTRSARLIEGEVKNKTEFGLFIGLDGDVDGMVHLSDLDWNRPGEQAIEEYKKGDMVKAKVLDVDVEKERISLGIKQLGGDPVRAKAGEMQEGPVVTGEVTEVKDAGIEVKFAGTDLTAFIRRADLARDRDDQRPERFAVGEKVDARVTQFDRKARKVAVSIKALEMAEEKEAIAAVRLVRFGRLARRHPGRGTAPRQRKEVTRDAKAAWLHAASRKIRRLAFRSSCDRGGRNAAEFRAQSDAAFRKPTFGGGFLAHLPDLAHASSW